MLIEGITPVLSLPLFTGIDQTKNLSACFQRCLKNEHLVFYKFICLHKNTTVFLWCHESVTLKAKTLKSRS